MKIAIEQYQKRYKLDAEDTKYVNRFIGDANEQLRISKEYTLYICFERLIDEISKLRAKNTKLWKEKNKLQAVVTKLHVKDNPILVGFLEREKEELEAKVEKLTAENATLSAENATLSEQVGVMRNNNKRRKNQTFNRTMRRRYGPFTYEYRNGAKPSEIMEGCFITRATYYRYKNLIKEVDELKSANSIQKADYKHQMADRIERQYAWVKDLAEKEHISADEVWEALYGKMPLKMERKKEEEKLTKTSGRELEKETRRLRKEDKIFRIIHAAMQLPD